MVEEEEEIYAWEECMAMTTIGMSIGRFMETTLEHMLVDSPVFYLVA